MQTPDAGELNAPARRRLPRQSGSRSWPSAAPFGRVEAAAASRRRCRSTAATARACWRSSASIRSTSPHEHVDFDLKTDSWAQLRDAGHRGADEPSARAAAAAGERGRELAIGLPVRAFRPHRVRTGGGAPLLQGLAEARASCCRTCCSPARSSIRSTKASRRGNCRIAERVSSSNSQEPYKGNMAWEALQAQVARDRGRASLRLHRGRRQRRGRRSGLRCSICAR